MQASSEAVTAGPLWALSTSEQQNALGAWWGRFQRCTTGRGDAAWMGREETSWIGQDH